MQRLRSLGVCVLGLWFLGATVIACDDESVPTDEECGGLCGCWEAVTVTFSATLQDASTAMPLEGIELVCVGEDKPIAVSDAKGALSFSIQTRTAAGCGLEACYHLKLHDPSGAHDDLQGTYYEFDGKTVSM